MPVDMHPTAVMENKHGNETTIHDMLYGCVTTMAVDKKLLPLPIICHAAPMAALLDSGASHGGGPHSNGVSVDPSKTEAVQQF